MTGLSISASGLLSAARRLDVTAHNIANVATPGFKALRAELLEAKGGGTTVGAVTQDSTPGPLNSEGLEMSNVNLALEMTNVIVSRNAYQANAAAFRAQADVVGTLFDLTG